MAISESPSHRVKMVSDCLIGTIRFVTEINDLYYAEINGAGEKLYNLLTFPAVSLPSSFSLRIPPPSIYLSPTPSGHITGYRLAGVGEHGDPHPKSMISPHYSPYPIGEISLLSAKKATKQ